MTHFTDSELACKCCGELNLAVGFKDKLEHLRETVGHPLYVSSCCRCKRNNDKNKGKENSFHLTTHPWGCCAVDIRIDGWTAGKRWKFVRQAMNEGWSLGINWSRGFIHIDRRTDYPEAGWPDPVIFPY